MEVYMIRHTSVDVPPGTCYGWTDVPTAETFEQEASVTKKNLEEMLQGKSFDKVYSSTLSRASKLAAFCGYPHPKLDSRLKEMFMGDWEMQQFDEIAKTDPHIQEWYNDFMHLNATNGESFLQLYARVADFFDELKKATLREGCYLCPRRGIDLRRNLCRPLPDGRLLQPPRGIRRHTGLPHLITSSQ